MTAAAGRPYLLERVEDAAIVQLYADGFEALTLREKTLAWHLYRAAIAGRDIYYDQRYRHALEMREVLEEILTHPRAVDPATLDIVHRYTKLFWLNSGPHHNLTAKKFVLACSFEALAGAILAAATDGARFPLRPGEALHEFVARIAPLFLDPDVDPYCTSKTPEAGRDILEASANNLYRDVRMSDLAMFDERHGLNSRLVRRGGALVEEVYKVDGRYGAEIAAIVRHLEAAVPFAPEPTAQALRALVRFYRTGEAEDREAYDRAFVEDRHPAVDTINGFIEVYLDARGMKGAWEALVYHVNHRKAEGIRALAREAQWFEDRMPWDPRWRRESVHGTVASAVDVIVETGDCGPVTPIGINLPNDQRIRERHGSKSVSLSNVHEAYEESTPASFRREFAWTAEETERAETWGAAIRELTTNLHEVIGHGSGRVEPRLSGSPQAALKEYYSALEEARADLVALYFIADPKVVELGLLPAESHQAAVLAAYEGYARVALVQLRQVRQGARLEEDHMRNRQLVVHWLMEHAGAIERRRRDGRTFYVVMDPAAFRRGVARLLVEVHRIKATGDREAAERLVLAHGVEFDPALRDEVVARVERLGLPSYTGFVMPRLTARRDAAGAIVDVTIDYPLDFTAQMLEYSGRSTA